MPLFLIQAFKQHALHPRSWSNVWIIEGGSLTDGETAAARILEAERAIHHSSVLFTYSRVSTFAPGDNSYTTLVWNQQGLRGGLSSPLPLFNTARVDFNVNGGGRPSRKFFRLPLLEDDVENGNVIAGLQAAIDVAMEELIFDLDAAATPLVDPDSQLFVSASPAVAIQMRQLHRRRRRSTPPTP